MERSLGLREGFSVTEDDHLALHGIDLIELCEEYGTPLFVFDQDCLVGNFERFRRAFESNYSKVVVCYSVKTNNNLTICRIMQSKGAYAEVASELDLYVAEKAGFSGDHIIFDGPFKSEKVLRRALEKEVLLINVESFAEMERLDKIAGELGIEQAVGLRINSFKPHGFLANVNPRILNDAIHCHPHSRFGFPLKDALSSFERSAEFNNLRIEGVMTHPYYRAVETLLPFMREVYQKLGVVTRYLNVGGGFRSGTTGSVGYKDLALDLMRQRFGLRSMLDEREESNMDIELVAKTITDNIKSNLGNLPEPTIVTEPGQFIAGPSGILLLRVDHTKDAGGYRWVIVDGGTNIVPIANVFTRRQIIAANKADHRRGEIVNIAGPLLFSDDVLARKTYLPKVDEGDILAIFDCGAYTLSSSTQFLYPRSAAVLLDSKREVRVIREKETCEDVFRKDKLL